MPHEYDLNKELDEIEKRLRKAKAKITRKEIDVKCSILEFELYEKYRLEAIHEKNVIRIYQYKVGSDDKVENIYTKRTANGVCFTLGIW